MKIPPADRIPGILHPRTRHSAKPAVAREVVEALVPGGPFAEMFARESAPGWSVWGNEAPNPDPWLVEVLG